MRILIEGERYSLDLLEELFDNQSFHAVNGIEGVVNHVGYFHNLKLQEVVYFLPKVFYWNKLVFGEFGLLDLAAGKIEITIKHNENYHWIRHLLILFYKSLVEYKKRNSDSILIEQQISIELNSNLGTQEYTFLDLMLSFLNFYKKHQSFTAFQTVENRSKQVIKPKWSKTIRKNLPFMNQKGQPIYTQIHNKKRTPNNEEELIVVFLSILNHFKKAYQLPISIDKGFQLYKGKRFEWLQNNGLKVLRKVKYKYFSDTLKRMYQLCELYLTKTDKSSVRKRKSEYISIRNYNLIFEDMVDKLFTDNTIDTEIQALKNNKDGKIIDHLFEHQSLIDTDHIYYIGDSKYYKSNTEAKGRSLYKQFAYAKNIIQFQIDLFNKNSAYSASNLRYRDELTEGYNISPNFFIYGFIPTEKEKAIIDFNENYLSSEGYEVKSSYHFRGRLFDRDTLFVHQYQMNFLFILKAYTLVQSSVIQHFRTLTKSTFRQDFINYFNASDKCGFRFYQKEISKKEMQSFVNQYFRILNGRCIAIENQTKLLIAVPNHEVELYDEIINGFESIELN
jgi:hypothetical protein